MSNVDVSVIIPNLHSPIIKHTLASLRMQNFKGRFEIIVVGQDKYRQVKEDEIIRLISTPLPVNPAKARNIGIRVAQGNILVFTDADCVAAPDWLSRLMNHYDSPEVNIVGGGVDIETDNYWTMCDNLATFYDYLVTSKPGVRSQLPSLNLSIRKLILHEVGYFDERYPLPAGEDSDLTTRLRMKGYHLYFDPLAKISHHPQRRNLRDILMHFYNFGRFSIKVDPRYQAFIKTPWPLRHWKATILLSPVLAGGITLRILLQTKGRYNSWAALPILFAAKLTWCLGAARTLRHGFPLK